MTSKYFSNKNSFDTLQDPIENCWGDYWHLHTHSYKQFCCDTDIFSCKDIERIKVIGKRLGISRSITGNGENCLDHRRSFTSWIKSNEHTEWIYRKLTDLVIKNNQELFNFELSMIETLQFTYYNSNEHGLYKCHVDTTPWQLPHNRKLSVVVQLSEPDEYEGGDLILHTSYDPIRIAKQNGMVTMFPSYTLHEVTPVTKGERYSLVAWVHGPAFK